MKQACLDLNLNARKTRKQAFLEQMDGVVPWAELVERVTPSPMATQIPPSVATSNSPTELIGDRE